MTWAENDAEVLALLTGFDARDAYSHRQRFPVLAPPTTGEKEAPREPPPTARNDVLVLVYEVLGELRRWLRRKSPEEVSDTPPTVQDLMAASRVDGALSTVSQTMTDAAPWPQSRSPDRFAVLRSAVTALVTEAWIARLRDGFAHELAQSLEAFRTRLAGDRTKYRTKYDDWLDEMDGQVALYDAFRPRLWGVYAGVWDEWNADMERIDSIAERLRRLDAALS